MSEQARDKVADIGCPRRRRAVELRAYQGKVFKEIGESLGVGAKRARSLYTEGMAEIGERVCHFGRFAPTKDQGGAYWSDDEFALSVRARNIIRKHQLSRTDLASMSYDDIRALRGVGPKAAREILDFMAT